MGTIVQILIGLVALEHIYILWMEMFAWESVGKKTFKKALPDELFKPTKGLAANQGLYNGFFGSRFSLDILYLRYFMENKYLGFLFGLYCNSRNLWSCNCR